MLFALWAMSNQKGEYRPDRDYKITSTAYSKLRENITLVLKEANTGRTYKNRKRPTMSDEQRAKRRATLIALNKKRTGRVVSEETRAKIRAKRALQDMSHLKGKTVSDETCAKIRAKRALQTNVKNQYSKSSPTHP